MTQSILVSVIIPCYNGAAFLADAVRSVRTPGDPLTEVLVVDDASTDDSAAVADRLAAADPAVRVIRRATNGGPAATRNTGLRAATGRYVCFLDADDQYAPGFLTAATRILDADPTVAGLVTGIELVNCHRPIHPIQLDAVGRSIPSNLMLCRAVVDLIGGFPEDPAFRGPTGGEDIAFRDALARHFRLTYTPHPHFRGHVQQGGHLDKFLDRSTVIDGQLVFTHAAPDGSSSALAAAHARYREMVRERVGVVAGLGGPDGLTLLAPHAARTVAEFDALRDTVGAIPGFLHPQEGYALYRWARDGPGSGAVVEIGSLLGCSSAWLAAGCRDARRGRVAAVDHFRGSEAHRPGGSHPIPELAVSDSTLPAFRANLVRVGLGDWVEPRVGESAAVARAWVGPVRLLFIDGDHEYEAVRTDWQAWVGHLVPGGVVAFHDVGVFPGVDRLYDEIRAAHGLREVDRVRTLRLVQLPR
jgi:predicted O-methyltransferase YrrM